MVLGESSEEPEAIKREITDCYIKLYFETEEWRPICNMNNCPIIEEEQQALQCPFDEKETLDCLKLCAIDKASGPDGYCMVSFYQLLGGGQVRCNGYYPEF